MKKIEFTIVTLIVGTIVLSGCSEHELCEKDRSLRARSAMSVGKVLQPGATAMDYAESARLLKESAAIGEEIEFRKISCKK